MKQINTNVRNFLITTSLSLFATLSFAQDTQKLDSIFSHITLHGSVDAYFRTNFNGLNHYKYNGAGDIIAAPQAPATSFANDPGFALGMANIILGYEGDKVGFVADLVFGPRGEDAVFLSNPSNNIINQLYMYYNLSKSVKLSLGNFNTFLGYEVISPVGNFNYSTSYMFSYGPFSHTGIKADFTFNNNWSAMIGIMNPTDYTEFNPFGLYSVGGQLGFSNDSGSAFLNVLYGGQVPNSDASFQIDLTTGWNFTDAFYLGLNTTFNSTNNSGFYGVALYPQLKASENFAIGLRAEYFKELQDGGPVYGADVRATEFTLTGNYTVGHLIIKPEFRLDAISEDVFLNSDLESIDNLSSFVLAAVYSF